MTEQPTADCWQQLSQLFQQALDLQVDARAGFIAQIGDDDLRRELEAMLAADGDTSAFDRPLAEAVDIDRLASAPPPPDAAIGQHLGVWQLQEILGRGGMGVVYAAHRTDGIAQQAAIKRLHAGGLARMQAERFEQERQILAGLTHPHIARLLDGGVDAHGDPWFAMERVDGEPITDWADARQLPLRARIELLLPVCAAIQHSHERFIVHRDLKPDNVLVDADGNPKVLDFGVAKLVDPLRPGTTRTGLAAGFTPEYATPEQLSGGDITAATDVYALGLVLYHLLTGRMPWRFDDIDLVARIDAISQQAPMRPEQAITCDGPDQQRLRLRQRDIDQAAFRRYVRGDLTRILQTALAKEPGRRYATVSAFAADLRRFLDGRPVSVGGDTFAYRARKFAARNRWGVGMAGLAVLLLVAGTAGILMQTLQARAEAARAEREAVRAEAAAVRANREVERMTATNEFMRSVFSSANPDSSGRPDITLREALDNTLRSLEQEPGTSHEAHIRFLLAAASSYEALGEIDKAGDAVSRALQLQEAELPNADEARGWILSAMAWMKMTEDSNAALALAEEALARQLASEPVSEAGVRDAMSVLSGVQYHDGDFSSAIETTRDIRQRMLDSGLDEAHQDVISTYSNEAIMLTALKRFDDASALHERVIALRSRASGPDAMQTVLERQYYGISLDRAGRHEEALRQFDLVMPALSNFVDENHPRYQSLVLARAGALVRLGRHADAIAPLSQVHDFARKHTFNHRQGLIAGWYVEALAALERCDEAQAVLDELAARDIRIRSDEGPSTTGDCALVGLEG